MQIENLPGPRLEQRRIALSLSLSLIAIILPIYKHFKDNATNLKIYTFMRDMRNVDDKEGSFEAQVTFRQQWNDPRLRFEQISRDIKCITIRDTKVIWMPGTFFSNEISNH